ncbi:hypothetical protein C1645_877344 [Glomus cerebriforme]|uniref:MARVEL domain-containing protein n=1 Tax=Glomus cerebriforme TaxID=658196 RepID=A0A397T098_9GLOM|nr:hypothetical protein C1645_877344 [Glomus cerebriforme]
MDAQINTLRLFLFFFRILQCSGSLTIVILEILRHTGAVFLIESRMTVGDNYLELFFEYCVMNLGFVTSVLYLIRFNQRCKLGPYKYDVLIDCVLMNGWMIFGILRLSPQFDNSNNLTCNQYEFKEYNGCVTYVSSLIIGYLISASYFFSALVTTWLWMEKNQSTINNNNSTNNNTINTNNNNNNHLSFSKSLTSTELGETRNSRAEFSLREFIEHNKHLSPLLNRDSEFNRTDGTIVIFRKPSPSYLKYESPSSHNSSLYENSAASEYSLDSSFSKTYGPIIIPRKYNTQGESDIINRNQIFSTYSDGSNNSNKRLSSALSDVTSRSSRYDGSIIIKLVT